LQVAALPESGFPTKTVAICGPPSTPCLLGSLERDGTALALWSLGSPHRHAVELPINGGRPWRMFAGAAIQCTSLIAAELSSLAELGDTLPGSWCLLLVGWDGSRFPVATLVMPNSTRVTSPMNPQQVLPGFDIPLRVSSEGAVASTMRAPSRQVSQRGSRRQLSRQHQNSRMVAGSKSRQTHEAICQDGKKEVAAVQSLLVDGQTGVLTALLKNGALLSWDILRMLPLGNVKTPWELGKAMAFKPTAMCGMWDGELHVVGLDPVTGPRWFRMLSGSSARGKETDKPESDQSLSLAQHV